MYTALQSHLTELQRFLYKKNCIVRQKSIINAFKHNKQNISSEPLDTFNLCRLLTGLRSWEWKEDWNSL